MEWFPCKEQLSKLGLWFGKELIADDVMEAYKIMGGMEKVNAENAE